MAKKKRKLEKIISREKTRKIIIMMLLGGYPSPIAIHASFI
jgi:hypothetical protein